MWFWWFMFICGLIVPITMIISGSMMWKHPPKNINGVIGYRTTHSMKNKDTWKFAQNYCGQLWWRIGWVMLILSIGIPLPFYHKSDNAIGLTGSFLCIMQCLILIASIFPTERALKKNFTDEGIRR